MNDLVTWLRAQLDEDERSAREEVVLMCDYPYPADFEVEYQWVRMARHPHGGTSTAFVPGSPSPARVLAEVDAKRRILAWDGPVCSCSSVDNPPMDPATNWTTRLEHHFDCDSYETAKLLALPYAARPGYREDWRP